MLSEQVQYQGKAGFLNGIFNVVASSQNADISIYAGFHSDNHIHYITSYLLL